MRLIGSRTATIFTPRANQPQVCCAVLQWVLHCDVSIVNATILPPRSCATSVLKCATSILPCGTSVVPCATSVLPCATSVLPCATSVFRSSPAPPAPPAPPALYPAPPALTCTPCVHSLCRHRDESCSFRVAAPPFRSTLQRFTPPPRGLLAAVTGLLQCSKAFVKT